MRRFLPLGLMFLTACNAPLDADWSAHRFEVEKAGTTYQVRTQYDPIDLAWYSRVSIFGGHVAREDVDLAVKIVENDIGPKLCDGQPMTISPSGLRGLESDPKLVYMPDLGIWQVVAQCT